MATIKSYTDISQSKKLAEILPLESADMRYVPFGDTHPWVWNEEVKLLEKGSVPCWSLSALLELIPERIPGTKLVIKWEGSYYIEGRDCLFDNAVDAAFEMIVWLKENGKI